MPTSSSSAGASSCADRARARARGRTVPLLMLVVPLQAWLRSGFFADHHFLPELGSQHNNSSEPHASQEFDASAGPDLEEGPGQHERGEVARHGPLAHVRLVVFDLAGTTMDDLVDGQPLAVLAIQAALSRVGVEAPLEAVTAFRGLEKRAAIRRLLRQFRPPAAAGNESAAADEDVAKKDEELVQRTYSYFKEALAEALLRGPLQEVPGASAAFEALRADGVRVFVSSGFSEDVVHDIVSRLEWEVDGTVAGARRPRPDAIFEAMARVGVQDVKRVLKVGDTVADVEEGRRAGVWTAVVLTGTQSEGDLRAAGPDFVVPSVADVPSLLYMDNSTEDRPEGPEEGNVDGHPPRISEVHGR